MFIVTASAKKNYGFLVEFEEMECCFDVTEEQLNPLEDSGQWSAT
jgi:hypothetical protein